MSQPTDQPTTPVLQHIAFEPEGGLQIGYYRPGDDLKANGVLMMRTLIIPAGQDYDDEIDAVIEAATYLVRDVLDDWPRLDSADAAHQRAITQPDEK